MNLKTLISELQKLEKKYGGDIPCRLQTDHGRYLMTPSWAGVSYIEEDTYMAEGVSEEDLKEYDSVIKVIEIQAF